MATDFNWPSTSVNHSRTKRMSRSSMARSTNSVCLSMGLACHRHVSGVCLPRHVPGQSCQNRAMTTMRLALAQVNPTVGDLAGNAAIVLGRTKEAVASGADLVVFPEMMLTGYPIEDLALRSSFQGQPPRHRGAGAAAGGRGCGGAAVVVGFLDADGESGGGARNAAAVLFEARWSPCTRSTTCPTTASSTSSATSFRGPRGWCCASTGPTWPWRSARTCGSPAVRSPMCGQLARACWSSSTDRPTSAPRTTCGSTSADGARPRRAAPWPTSTWSAARTSSCSTATRWSSAPTGGCSRAPTSSWSSCWCWTSICRRPRVLRGEPRSPPQHRREPPALPEPVVAPELADAPEVYRALVLGLGDYVRKNGFSSVALGLSGESTRPWWRRSPATPSEPSTSSGSRCRASTRRSIPATTPPNWRGAPACATAPFRSHPWLPRSTGPWA